MKREDQEKSVTLSIPITDELYAKVRALADAAGISMAALARMIIGLPPARIYRRKPKKRLEK